MTRNDRLRLIAEGFAVLVCAIATASLLLVPGGAPPSAALALEGRAGVIPSLGLLLSSAALWLLLRPGSTRAATMLALSAVALVLLGGAAIVLGWVAPGWVWGDIGDPQTAIAVVAFRAILLASGALAVVGLGFEKQPRRWSISAGLANLAMAMAITGLLGRLFGANAPHARTLGLEIHLTLAVLLLSLGSQLARPRDRLLQMLFDGSTTGTLARNFFLGAVLPPVILSVALLATVQAQAIAPGDALVLLAGGLILCSLAVSTHSTRAAAQIEDERNEAAETRLMLTARLQQQAAELQQIVSQRTEELEKANAGLRVAAESNALLASVAEHTSNGIIVADSAGRAAWVNAAFTRITGLNFGDVKERDPGQFLPGPDTDPATVARLHRALEKGEPCRLEMLSRTKDGSPFWIALDVQPVRDRAGAVAHFIIAVVDKTDERALQHRLLSLNDRLGLATRSAELGVWECDAQSRLRQCDARTLEIYGLRAEEYGGRREEWVARLHPDDRGRITKALEALECGGHQFEHEFRIIRANDGAVRVVDSRAIVQRNAAGELVRITGTDRDVTEHRQLVDRLRKSEEIAREVASIARVGGWEYDFASAHLTWNDGVRTIHEVDESFQPSLASTAPFYPESPMEIWPGISAAGTDSPSEFDQEIRLLTARANERWLRIFGRIERDAQGRPLRMHGAMQDITDSHQSEQARRALEVQLFQAQKMETLGTLAGGIAHDFNNLLTGIIGNHELAADSLPEDHPARPCLGEARKASLRARELIDQILTFGRQPCGENHVPVDLPTVLEESRRFLRSTVPATISIELRIAPDLPLVFGDPTQINQMLLNLGSNAAHAMRAQGGTLSITAEPAEVTSELAFAFGGSPAGSYVRLTVADTGHGMDEATRIRIFDPFFTTKGTREGTGLGLAVVHGIVRAHQGIIDVESKPGQGARFHIYLPAAGHSDELALSGDTAAAIPGGTGERLFIVDDEEIVGSCSRRVLESKGYLVSVFRSAEECLAALEGDDAHCALVITDQTMPGMSGTELIATFRQRLPGLPAVLMSGYFSRISPTVLGELGQVELLAKPFTSEELLAAVHGVLHLGKRQSAPVG